MRYQNIVKVSTYCISYCTVNLKIGLKVNQRVIKQFADGSRRPNRSVLHPGIKPRPAKFANNQAPLLIKARF